MKYYCNGCGWEGNKEICPRHGYDYIQEQFEFLVTIPEKKIRIWAQDKDCAIDMVEENLYDELCGDIDAEEI